jgi:hypothetical protein
MTNKTRYVLTPVLVLVCVANCTVPTPWIVKETVSATRSSDDSLRLAAITPAPLSTLSPLPDIFPKIDRRPAPAVFRRGALAAVPSYDPDSKEPSQVDLRASDLSSLDLTHSLGDLLYADFDDQTVWPPKKRMPRDFDWERILELGRNPGLGVRSLHARGITGRGVSIAIVDQPLLVDHQEYSARLHLYEEINIEPDTESQMHGPAVASIAVGETVGVAPGARLYYIGSWAADWDGKGGFTWNFQYFAQAVRRLVEISAGLPRDQRIRVIAMQIGFSPEMADVTEINAAIEEAKAAGMLVVCSTIEQVHGFKFHGLGREPMADPDAFESYGPGLWWAETYYAGNRFDDRLLIPMDSRTTAGPLGADEYVFYRQGGWSWAMPYIAGLYALAAQVDRDITPDRFWSLALETGRTIVLDHGGQEITFGPIVDPVALIAALQAQ